VGHPTVYKYTNTGLNKTKLNLMASISEMALDMFAARIQNYTQKELVKHRDRPYI
jgi:hypothetical protein